MNSPIDIADIDVLKITINSKLKENEKYKNRVYYPFFLKYENRNICFTTKTIKIYSIYFDYWDNLRSITLSKDISDLFEKINEHIKKISPIFTINKLSGKTEIIKNPINYISSFYGEIYQKNIFFSKDDTYNIDLYISDEDDRIWYKNIRDKKNLRKYLTNQSHAKFIFEIPNIIINKIHSRWAGEPTTFTSSLHALCKIIHIVRCSPNHNDDHQAYHYHYHHNYNWGDVLDDHYNSDDILGDNIQNDHYDWDDVLGDNIQNDHIQNDHIRRIRCDLINDDFVEISINDQFYSQFNNDKSDTKYHDIDWKKDLIIDL